MRAAIAGDIIGSRFERSIWSGDHFLVATCTGYDVEEPRSNSIGERASDFELFHADCHLTDDSILMIALIDWILRRGDLASRFREHFRRANRPELFGRIFREWAISDTAEPCQSFGNGAAMRVAPLAYLSDDPDVVCEWVRQTSKVTHPTDDAIRGAEAIALGVLLGRLGKSKETIQDTLESHLGVELNRSIDEIRPHYRFSSAVMDTVPCAIRAFLESEDFDGTIRRAISLGGDSDTIACMSGALAGAFWGTPLMIRTHVTAYLDADQLELLLEFEERYPQAKRTIF